jgi:large subunit GTPase 1
MSQSGKKNGSPGLGRAILKERNRGRRSHNGGSWLHTSELDDGLDWNKLNLRSVTEESQLDEFLRTAELAGTEFTAERLNVKVVDPSRPRGGLPSVEEEREIERTHSKFRQFIGIPRRPEWGPSTTPEQLDLSERDSYLAWRRNLARLEEDEGLIFTPFEKNLQFWRQLWRVIERSDIIVQIVDARNPLLFHCEDLEQYVKEVSAEKVNLLLLSKADLLSQQQRLSWSQYFSERGVTAAFWSAQLAEQETTTTTTTTEMSSTDMDDNMGGEPLSSGAENETESVGTSASPEILSRERLLQLFRDLSLVPEGGITTVGLVGYPNVGKSSTINVLYQEKKVPVSATPGRTKHFQTLLISEQLQLCDCPGLVFPSLVSTKAEMVVSGILPIDHMRDHTPPVSLVTPQGLNM